VNPLALASLRLASILLAARTESTVAQGEELTDELTGRRISLGQIEKYSGASTISLHHIKYSTGLPDLLAKLGAVGELHDSSGWLNRPRRYLRGARFMGSGARYGCGLVGGFFITRQRVRNFGDEEPVLLSWSWFQILPIPVYGASSRSYFIQTS
jgi:hypothetical protein